MKNNKGFSLVEIVIAIAIATMFFLSIYELLLFANKVTHTGLRKIEAIHFAQEGIEAVRMVRDSGWTNNISTLTDETTYYLSLVGDHWELTALVPPLINSVFTRTVVLQAVNRDANDDISAIGTADLKTKKVVVGVSWQERGINHSVSLETYITNFLAN